VDQLAAPSEVANASVTSAATTTNNPSSPLPLVDRSQISNEDILLDGALTAFGRWKYPCEKDLETWKQALTRDLKGAGITSFRSLVECKRTKLKTIATAAGIPSFLPGKVGIQCFQLAQAAVLHAKKVKSSSVVVTYKHGKGIFRVPADWQNNPNNKNNHHHHPPEWIMHVDCSGFVRHVYEFVTQKPMKKSLSDRSYMRAKDFYSFFMSLPYSVTDRVVDKSKPHANWRRVDDLRLVLPGDIIVYCVQGRAAGGVDFVVKNNVQDILWCVKTAQVYRHEMEKQTTLNDDHGQRPLVTRNLAEKEVREWAEHMTQVLLTDYGIETRDQLEAAVLPNLPNNNMEQQPQPPHLSNLLDSDTMELIRLALQSKQGNTGHIVFVAGKADPVTTSTSTTTTNTAGSEWRIPVYHSTGIGSKPGVQAGFKRFVYDPIEQRWTRRIRRLTSGGGSGGKNSGNDDVVLCDGKIVVLAARMCF
jgi:hypothetical protein